MDTMKVFISQPMRGKTFEEITEEREAIIETMKKMVAMSEDANGPSIEIVDSLLKEQSTPVNDLGKSLQFLSQADLAIFAEGWEDANGCSIEHSVCEKYDISIAHCYKSGVRDGELDIVMMTPPKPIV